MLCMKCGARLSDRDYCPKCGADVKIYKRLVKISNAYYNKGLVKAGVRDLSGAILDLKYSLEIHKYNIQARNLLGLIYFEMGDVVEALTEWIISKSLEPQKNIAEQYIQAIQKNPARLDTINQTIKKYNQSLLYCQQDSEDLAIIQLKKVLSLNPNLIKAHLLLGLLYIKTADYERAYRELKRVLAIDCTNTLALYYRQELDLLTKEGKGSYKKEEKKSDVISYTSGNETIIMPTTYKDTSGANVAINIVIGMVIGVALMWFLVVPSKIKIARNEANQQIVEYSDQLSAKQATIDSLLRQLEEAEARLNEGTTETVIDVSVQDAADQLAEATAAYHRQDLEGAKTILAGIDTELLTESGITLYRQLDLTLNPEYYQNAYAQAKALYDAQNYQEAIGTLEMIVQVSPEFENGYPLYYLARSYESTAQNEKAVTYFTMFAEMLPQTERGAYARDAIRRLGGQ